MLTCQHFVSGIGQYGYHLSKHLRDQGLCVNLYKPGKSGHADQHFDQLPWIHPVSYRSFRGLHPYLLPLYLASRLKSGKNTLLHGHWFMSGLAASFRSRKCVVTMHDVSLLHIKERNGLYERYYRFAIDRFKKMNLPVITVSEKARQDAIEFAGLHERQVFAVHNGIDTERFFPVEATGKPKGDKPFTIVYAGGLGPRKNLSLLLHAYGQLLQQYPFLQLKIAGGWPENTPWPAMAHNLGLKNVTFTGFIPDHLMGDFYRNADLFIYPSTYEGFGFAPLEAMACGVPVLSASGGALAETAGGGACLFEYDTDDLVAKAAQLIEDTTIRASLRKRGIAWAKQFSWQKAAGQTLDIYRLVS